MLYFNPNKLQELQEAKQLQIKKVRTDKQRIKEERARQGGHAYASRNLFMKEMKSLDKSIERLNQSSELDGKNTERRTREYMNKTSDPKIHSINSYLKGKSCKNISNKFKNIEKKDLTEDIKLQDIATEDEKNRLLNKETSNKYNLKFKNIKDTIPYTSKGIKTLTHRERYTKSTKKRPKTPHMYKSDPLLAKPSFIIKQNELFIHIVGENSMRNLSSSKAGISTCSRPHKIDPNQLKNEYIPYRYMLRDIQHDKHSAVYSERLNRMTKYYKNRVKTDFQPLPNINKTIEREWRYEKTKLKKLTNLKRINISDIQ